MTVEHPCPACEDVVDVLAVLDGRATPGPDPACPECHTARDVLYALADELVTVEACRGEKGERLIIPTELRQEIAEKREAMDDPADEVEYSQPAPEVV